MGGLEVMDCKYKYSYCKVLWHCTPPPWQKKKGQVKVEVSLGWHARTNTRATLTYKVDYSSGTDVISGTNAMAKITPSSYL